MEYQISNSGTDDDHPPSNQNRVLRGSSSAGNARSAEEDAAIHQAEKEAYSSVVRAFKYQADDISWDKVQLMTDLRKELKISDDEHRELLRAVNTDETLQSIRKWRQTSCYQPATCNTSQPVHEDLPSPTVSASRKKRKKPKKYKSLRLIIQPEDFLCKGKDPGIQLRGGHSDQGRRSGDKGDTLGAEREVRFNLQATEEFPSQQNVIGNRALDDIVLMKTDVLLKKVEDICAVSSPGSLEREEAMKKLKEHEQDLVTAIAKIDMLEDEMLENTYNSESEDN